MYFLILFATSIGSYDWQMKKLLFGAGIAKFRFFIIMTNDSKTTSISKKRLRLINIVPSYVYQKKNNNNEIKAGGQTFPYGLFPLYILNTYNRKCFIKCFVCPCVFYMLQYGSLCSKIWHEQTHKFEFKPYILKQYRVPYAIKRMENSSKRTFDR